MEERFEAAVFDFGGVLTSPIHQSFAAFETSLGIPKDSILHAFISAFEGEAEPTFFRLERGEITEGEFYDDMHRRLCEHLGQDVPFPDEPVEVRQAMFGALERNEPMIEASHAIAATYPAAILTNNVREWTEWRDWVGAHVFREVVDSAWVGMRKPQPEIYHLTCERLGVDPRRTLFVDDIASNVEGAAAVGMHAIHFVDTDAVVAELREAFPRAFVASASSSGD